MELFSSLVLRHGEQHMGFFYHKHVGRAKFAGR